MSSPIQLNPYEALNVSKDADLATIRKAHRKLVLEHHPDRIRDEAQRERGKIQFQKVQQAYELLSDPTRRGRYDDQIKLAELQKEKMMRREQMRREFREDPREAPREAPRTARPPPPDRAPPSSRRGDGLHYEDRAPPADFFDARDYFDEQPSRGSARKTDSYEKKSSTPKSSEKKERVQKMWYGPTDGISYKIASKVKEKASEAKDRAHKQKQEARDREVRHERSAKHSRRAYVSEYSESDSDTVVPKRTPRPSMPSSRAKGDSEPESGRSRPSSKKAPRSDDESYDEKWEHHHRKSTEYIAQSQRRPDLHRSGSDAYHYWESDTKPSRRSGSDEERRSSPPKSRRSAADDSRSRPSMPVHSSAPSNLRPHVVDRDPPAPTPRAKTQQAYPAEREARREREPPSLSRAQTMPVRPKKDSTVPTRGSNLKHAETQDSGYESRSNPRTPEMRGDSPPARETSRRGQTSTKYTIVEPAVDSDDESIARGPRILRADDERRFMRSPERYGRDRDRERERERDREQRDRERERERPRESRPERPVLGRLDTEGGRSRSARMPPSSMPRGEYARYESQSPRESPTAGRGRLFGEVSGDDREPQAYSYRPDTGHVRTASYRAPAYSSYRGRDPEYDYGADSRFREQLNHPMGRRSSAAH